MMKFKNVSISYVKIQLYLKNAPRLEANHFINVQIFTFVKLIVFTYSEQNNSYTVQNLNLNSAI